MVKFLGTERQKFFWVKNSMLWEQIHGQLDVFFMKWQKKNHYLWEIVKSIKFLKSSKCMAPLMKVHGLVLHLYLILKLVFPLMSNGFIFFIYIFYLLAFIFDFQFYLQVGDWGLVQLFLIKTFSFISQLFTGDSCGRV